MQWDFDRGRVLNKKYSVDLAAQMAECEANYARIMQLLPDMEASDGREFGVERPGATPLRLCIRVTERCKYTTMLDIEQLAPPVQAISGVPVMAATFSLRIYHDARMAEVVAFNRHRTIQPQYDYPNENMYHRDEKVQLNRFLGEWLSHCLKYGHTLEDPAEMTYSRV